MKLEVEVGEYFLHGVENYLAVIKVDGEHFQKFKRNKSVGEVINRVLELNSAWKKEGLGFIEECVFTDYTEATTPPPTKVREGHLAAASRLCNHYLRKSNANIKNAYSKGENHGANK